jgi:hypothetical protein
MRFAQRYAESHDLGFSGGPEKEAQEESEA